MLLLLPSCGDDSNQGQQPAGEAGYITVEPPCPDLTTELVGRTSAVRVSEIRPQVSGIIQKQLFEEGAVVGAG